MYILNLNSQISDKQIILLPNVILHHLQQPVEYVSVLFFLSYCPLQHFPPTPKLPLKNKTD